MMLRDELRGRFLPKLAELLGVELPAAIGMLTLMWDHCADETPAGDIGMTSNREIARACHWLGDPDDFVAAILRTEWIAEHPQHRLVVCKWKKRVPPWVRSKVKSRGLEFCFAPDEEPPQQGQLFAKEDPPPPDPIVLTFKTKPGHADWPLHQSKVDQYRESFTRIDVMESLRAAWQWCEDNPTRRKTFGGMAGYLGKFLSGDNKAATGNGRPPTRAQTTDAALESVFTSIRESSQ